MIIYAARLDAVIPGIADEIATHLVEAGHETCPYSKMVRGGIETSVALHPCALDAALA
ncbi:hypothetical protein [Sphingomonas sp. PR090111-T3T-6A]|uniref:hypothetical protein n=1 Tax=Sphingomonas sp. PR090111-T3T-6A TaxID=685778 RepID=UPI000365A1F3|nr:hypothetical protein [Sphingomonas sp. PR090111-T3T-6A]